MCIKSESSEKVLENKIKCINAIHMYHGAIRSHSSQVLYFLCGWSRRITTTLVLTGGVMLLQSICFIQIILGFFGITYFRI